MACKQQPLYRKTLEAHSCFVDAAMNDTRWERYLTGVAEFRDTYPISWRILVDRIIDVLRAKGCDALIEGGFIPDGGSWPIDLCAISNTYNLKPLRFMCPVSCKCSTDKEKYLCPGTCNEFRH